MNDVEFLGILSVDPSVANLHDTRLRHKVNDVVEVIGILSVDPSVANFQDTGEDPRWMML